MYVADTVGGYSCCRGSVGRSPVGAQAAARAGRVEWSTTTSAIVNVNVTTIAAAHRQLQQLGLRGDLCSAKAWLGSRSARKRTLRARAHTELNARFSGRRTIVQSVRALCAWIVHTLRVRGLLHAVSERSIRLRCELACDSDLGGTSHRTCARLP